MTVAVQSSAEADLEEAFGYYQSMRPGLGMEFLSEFRRAVYRMLAHPHGWHALDSVFRRCRLHRFPYGVIYRVDVPGNQLVVVAIHHLHRRPGAWRERPGL